MKSNPDKCHANRHLDIKIGDYTIGNSECEKLLGVKIDVNLNFNNHISDLCKKASRKISALARVAPFMSFNKRKLLQYFHNILRLFDVLPNFLFTTSETTRDYYL